MAQLEKMASKMLAVSGVRAIWDIHLAAAAAYGIGRHDVAGALVEIAEAAERLWMHRTDLTSAPGPEK